MCELILQSANIVEVLILKSCFDVQIGELNYYIIKLMDDWNIMKK